MNASSRSFSRDAQRSAFLREPRFVLNLAQA
jgi:hypothetical protein